MERLARWNFLMAQPENKLWPGTEGTAGCVALDHTYRGAAAGHPTRGTRKFLRNTAQTTGERAEARQQPSMGKLVNCGAGHGSRVCVSACVCAYMCTVHTYLRYRTKSRHA